MMRILVLFAALLPLGIQPLAAAPVKRKPAAAHSNTPVDWSKIVMRTPDGGIRMGNPYAKVQLIEYGARTCPTCAKFAQEGVAPLTGKYVSKGQVSYEFRDYPVHGALDLGPILLGNCVPVIRFFPVLAAMMAQQKILIGREGQVPDAKAEELQHAKPNDVASYLADFYGYTDFMVKQGLQRVRGKACLADSKALDTLVARTNAANMAYKISGTPTFIIAGKTVPNVVEWATLEPVLQTALAAK